jgi:hypothetical protein
MGGRGWGVAFIRVCVFFRDLLIGNFGNTYGSAYGF